MSPFAPPIFKSGRSASHEVATFRRCRRADRSSKPTGGLWAVKQTGCKRPTADIAKAHRLGLADAVMMHDQSRLTFSDHGAELFAGALAGSLADLRAALAHLPSEQAGIRIRGIEALRPFLACGGAIGSIAANVLGQRCRPVRAIFFDKTAETNWSLAWHQDRTICVQRRIDMDGFGPWTIKGGMQHVAPPFDLLTRMVTLRAHLDDVPATNAPLLIAPGSHAEGRVPVDVIEQVVSKCGTRVCTADAGDLWLYATPILHASEAASRPAHRRVLQIDFSADELPGGLEWLGV